MERPFIVNPLWDAYNQHRATLWSEVYVLEARIARERGNPECADWQRLIDALTPVVVFLKTRMDAVPFMIDNPDRSHTQEQAHEY